MNSDSLSTEYETSWGLAKGRCFETLDELTFTLNAALDYWNDHRHPYQWKKRSQEQVIPPGGFGVARSPRALAI